MRPSMPAPARAPPPGAVPLALTLCRRARPRARDGDLADAQGQRLLFHAVGVDAPISRQQLGRSSEQSPVLQDGRDGLVAI